MAIAVGPESGVGRTGGSNPPGGTAPIVEQAATEAATGTPAPTSEAVVLTLAHATIAEATFNAVDRAAILHALARRAARRGVAIDVMARMYVSAFRVTPTPRLRWVLAVDESCEQPAHWPSRLSWPAHRPRCRRAFEDVRRFLRGVLPDPCPGRADHWAGMAIERDRIRADRAVQAGRWIPAHCAGARNAFFRQVRR